MNYPPAKASGFPRLISFLVSWLIDLITLSVLPDTILNASPCFCLKSDLVPKPDYHQYTLYHKVSQQQSLIIFPSGSRSSHPLKQMGFRLPPR